MSKDRTVILIGASVRALAFSALRAGWQPWCADLFADADLHARCPALALPREDYPEGFARLLKKAPPGPVIYTGGLENYPKLLNRLARTRPVWGIHGRALQQVRTPEQLAAVLERVGLPCPRLQTDPSQLTEDCQWLAKPRRGTAGHGIHWVGSPTRGEGGGPGLDARLAERSLAPAGRGVGGKGDVPPSPLSPCGRGVGGEGEASAKLQAAAVRPGCYFQEFISGQPQAALYAGLSGSAYLLGVTRQLVGETWLHAAPFQYCGSIGRLTISKTAWRHYHAVGQALVAGFGLEGLFGVDFILRDRIPYPVEVNPRWPASAEVLEHALGVPLLSYHLLPFAGSAAGDKRQPVPAGVVGKAILYAPGPFLFPEKGPWQREIEEPRDLWELPDFADIPPPGQPFYRGQPVLTVFARTRTVDRCLAALKEKAAEVYEEIDRRSGRSARSR